MEDSNIRVVVLQADAQHFMYLSVVNEEVLPRIDTAPCLLKLVEQKSHLDGALLNT